MKKLLDLFKFKNKLSRDNKFILYYEWMKKGVVFTDLSTTYIDETVILSPQVEVGPMTVLQNHTYIGPGTKIKAFSEISNSKIGANNLIWSSTIIDSEINDNVTIGPYAFIRGNCRIKDHSSIGAHSELNDTILGEYSKCKHFSYLGHASIGINVNIGAGTVTCNYDGKKKFKTSIQDHAFVGSGTMLVAPLAVGKNAMVGAGSVVTKDIPDEALAFGVPARVNGKSKNIDYAKEE